MTDDEDDSWSRLLGALGELTAVDLSHPLKNGMPGWPTHARYDHRLVEDIPDTAARHYRLVLGEHTGTHLDAASHVIPDAPDISVLPATGLLVAASVIKVPADEATRLTADMLLEWERRHGRLAAGGAALIAFGWHTRWNDPDYMRRWPALVPDAGQLLAERSLALVAVDTLSVDAPEAGTLPVHQALLSASTLIGENFANLRQLPQRCLLSVLPLPIENGTGSPVRPVAYTRIPPWNTTGHRLGLETT